jgi:Kef-type K+ transport system membrane component KefB
MHVAEFGVVMMLFLVGLELRPNLLWRLRGPILAFRCSNFFAPAWCASMVSAPAVLAPAPEK